MLAIKRKCNCDVQGYKIQILDNNFDVRQYKEQSPHLSLSCDYSYESLYEANAELKIKLLENLLSFEGDTMMTCTIVKTYAAEKTKLLSRVTSKSYPIQVDVLYHINYICFGTYAPFFAPFPVLYDKATKKEINWDFKKLKEVFHIYKTWIEECKKNNFSIYSFPLLNTHYEWRFGGHEKKIFKHFPIIRGELKYRLGRPKLSAEK